MEHSGPTGLTELDRSLLLELTYPQIINLCLTSKEYLGYCSDEIFWRMKLARDYPPSLRHFNIYGLSSRELNHSRI